MITQAELVLLKLRELILNGEFLPGSHLMEVSLSEQLGVSRTPVRLALGALAQEGLLRYTPKSGFIVKSFSIKEITDGVAVRGRLESMACRTVAENGAPADVLEALHLNIEATAQLTRLGSLAVDDVRRWCDLNGDFHEKIVDACGNETLQRFAQQFASIPLVAPRHIAATYGNIDRIAQLISESLVMHRLVLDAIERRQPERADFLMQEHVHQGEQGLRRFLESMSGQGDGAAVGAVKLVAP